MKTILAMMMRYTAAVVLCAVCAVSVIVMLAYYQEKEALIPAAVACMTFMGAQIIFDTTNNKYKKNGTEKVLPCGDGAE